IINTFNIPPENIWNFDEKGFIIGLCGRYIVYTRTTRKNPGRLTSTGNCQSTTDDETISAAGKFLPPYIVNKGVIHNAAKFRYISKDVLAGASFANAPEGVMVCTLSIDYLRDHFDKHSRPFMSANCNDRLLIWDSHLSHVSLDVRRYGVARKIHLLTFPGHQTHKLQPLDVGIFSPLANAYKIALDRWGKANRDMAMSQADFFVLLHQARGIALTEKNIRSSFETTGMYEYIENMMEIGLSYSELLANRSF
ncbi:CENP-B protein, partial [Ascobolus immersus RN42]